MFSALIRNRSIAFSPDDAGASGAGGPTVIDDADDVEREAGDAGEDGKKKEEVPAWKQRLNEIRKLGKDDDAEGEGDDENKGEPGKKKETPTGAPKAKSDAADDEKGTGPIMVKVPGRHAEDEEIEIPLDRAALKAAGVTIKEARDRIAHLKNGFARRAELETDRADIASARAELDEIKTEIQDKPVDFFLDHVDRKQYRPLVEALITRMSNADFTALVQRVAEYDADGSRRRDDGATAREAQAERRDAASKKTEAEQKRDAYVKEVTAEINAFVPDDMSDEDAEEFFEFATTRLQNHVRKTGAKGIAPKEIAGLLKDLGVLERFGLDETPSPAAKGKTPPSGRRPAPSNGRPAPGKPRDTAADLEDRRDRKRGAVTTPGGAGAPAAGAPPKGQGILARLNFIRKSHGVPEKKYDTTK